MQVFMPKVASASIVYTCDLKWLLEPSFGLKVWTMILLAACG